MGLDPITYGAAVAKSKKLIKNAQLNPYEVEGTCKYTDLTSKEATAKKNDVWILSEEYPKGSATPTYTAGTAFAYNGNNTWRVVQMGNYISNAKITLTQGGETKGEFRLNQSADQTITLDVGIEKSVWIQDVAPDSGSVGITGDIILCRNDGKVYECGGGTVGAYVWTAMTVPNTSIYYSFMRSDMNVKDVTVSGSGTSSVITVSKNDGNNLIITASDVV